MSRNANDMSRAEFIDHLESLGVDLEPDPEVELESDDEDRSAIRDGHPDGVPYQPEPGTRCACGEIHGVIAINNEGGYNGVVICLRCVIDVVLVGVYRNEINDWTRLGRMAERMLRAEARSFRDQMLREQSSDKLAEFRRWAVFADLGSWYEVRRSADNTEWVMFSAVDSHGRPRPSSNIAHDTRHCPIFVTRFQATNDAVARAIFEGMQSTLRSEEPCDG